MTIDFATAMRRATERTQAGDVLEATRLIQAALGGGAVDIPEPATAPGATRPASGARRFRIDRAAQDAEVADETGVAETPPAAPSRPTRLRVPLGQAVATLRAARRAASGVPVPGLRRRAQALADGPIPPEGAQFLRRSYRGAAGARDYRLYVPSTAATGVRGLVVMLHGCTQTPEDFAVGARMNAAAEAQGLLVAYPAQTGAHNAQSCWNWFNPADQRRGAGEPALLAGLASAVAQEFGVAADAVFVAGLSAGGAMAAVLGDAYPDVFAAVGVHSGLPAGAANDVMSAFAAMRGEFRAGDRSASAGGDVAPPRLIVFHGDADRTVNFANAEALMADALARRPGATAVAHDAGTAGGRGWRRSVVAGADGAAAVALWRIEGAGHAWSGGDGAGSYADPSGPDASAEMVRFFLETPRAGA